VEAGVVNVVDGITMEATEKEGAEEVGVDTTTTTSTETGSGTTRITLIEYWRGGVSASLGITVLIGTPTLTMLIATPTQWIATPSMTMLITFLQGTLNSHPHIKNIGGLYYIRNVVSVTIFIMGIAALTMNHTLTVNNGNSHAHNEYLSSRGTE